MATWTDFELQQALRQMQPNGGSQNIGGYWVSPQYGNQYWEGQGENSQMVPGAATEYQVTKDLGKGKNGIIGGGGSAQYENAAYDRYGADGQFLGSDQYKDMGTDGFTKAMAYLTAAAGLGGIGATMYGAGAAGAGAAGTNVMGAGAAGLESGTLANGVTIGGPMSVGLPVGTALPAMGAMGGVGGALGAAAGGGGATTAAGAAGSLIPGVSNSALLGGATTLLGAASGAGGGSGGAGGGRTLDPRMESYLYDANGLMPMTQGLLQRQAPIAEQNGQLLGDRARGLLGRGIATNPFLKG